MTTKLLLFCLLASIGSTAGTTTSYVDVYPSDTVITYDECTSNCDGNTFCQSAYYDTVSGACEQYDCIINETTPPTLKKYIKPGSSSQCPSNVALPTAATSSPSPTTSISSASSTPIASPGSPTSSQPTPSPTSAGAPSFWSKPKIGGLLIAVGTCFVVILVV